ncbi:MAG: hypothetical protein GOV15_03435 [Candidatus Diapherotrites archaeon]|nr:hypothetical protein [Candidatus Diapherotrites archaeon]
MAGELEFVERHDRAIVKHMESSYVFHCPFGKAPKVEGYLRDESGPLLKVERLAEDEKVDLGSLNGTRVKDKSNLLHEVKGQYHQWIVTEPIAAAAHFLGKITKSVRAADESQHVFVKQDTITMAEELLNYKIMQEFEASKKKSGFTIE